MNRSEIFSNIKKKNSFLCVGLDSDIRKIPAHLLKEKDPVFEFNRQIIDATADYCIAYKPNTAFYEALGAKGWESLQKTIEYIPKDIFTIADAKRGDIGNTSSLYARAFFDKSSGGLDFDSITVAPYMGEDSVKPFMEFNGKFVILLAFTSNSGNSDFQNQTMADGEKLFEKIMKSSMKWGNEDQLMFVVGATNPESIKSIREIAKDYFFLVPGVGAQGGDLAAVAKYGINKQCGLIVNSSRNIIFASNDTDFSKTAGKAAKSIRDEMKILLEKYLS